MTPRQSFFLIQAPYLDDYGPLKKAAGTYFPLGLGYVAAAVRKNGFKVDFCDPNVQGVGQADIARMVRDKKPLLVGISFMTPQFVTVKRLVESIKQAAPETPVALGGAHPSVMPQRTLEEIPDADFVVVGEGEVTAVELLEALASGARELSDIAGLAWRDKGRIVVNPPRELIRDLDSLAFPDRGLIDQDLYQQQSFLSYFKSHQTIYTSRGCPGRCVYCASGNKLRSRIRLRSVENIMEELRAVSRSAPMDYLLIKDDMFTISKSRTMDFCDAIEREFPGLKWHCMCRVDSVDEELLRRMKRAGLNDTFFGIESGNNEILRKAGKNITIDRIRTAVETAARIGIKTYGAFILGLPGETPETIRQTIDFACSLPLTMAGFSILIPYPGTKCFDEYYRAGSDGIDYGAFIASTGMHYVKEYTGLNGLKVEELPGWVSRAQKRFYFRPSQVYRMLKGTTPLQLAGYARGGLAMLNRILRVRLTPTS